MEGFQIQVVRIKKDDIHGSMIPETVAPLFKLDPASIIHDFIGVITDDGSLHIISCEHGLEMTVFAYNALIQGRTNAQEN